MQRTRPRSLRRHVLLIVTESPRFGNERVRILFVPFAPIGRETVGVQIYIFRKNKFRADNRFARGIVRLSNDFAVVPYERRSRSF